MLVPWNNAKSYLMSLKPPGPNSNTDEYTLTPGAQTSGLIAVVNFAGPCDEKPARMSALPVMNSVGVDPSIVAVPEGLIALPSPLLSMTAGMSGKANGAP